MSWIEIDEIRQFPAGGFLAALTIVAMVVVFSGLGSLYFFSGASSDSIILRCDRSAVLAADRAHDDGGNERDWRRKRQLAFQRCVDESLQTLQKPHP